MPAEHSGQLQSGCTGGTIGHVTGTRDHWNAASEKMDSSLKTCVVSTLYLKDGRSELRCTSMLEQRLGFALNNPAHAFAGELSDFINSDLMKTDASRASDMR